MIVEDKYLEKVTRSAAMNYSQGQMTAQRAEPIGNGRNGDGTPFETVYRYSVMVHPDKEKSGNKAMVIIPKRDENKIALVDYLKLKSENDMILAGWFA